VSNYNENEHSDTGTGFSVSNRTAKDIIGAKGLFFSQNCGKYYSALSTLLSCTADMPLCGQKTAPQCPPQGQILRSGLRADESEKAKSEATWSGGGIAMAPEAPSRDGV